MDMQQQLVFAVIAKVLHETQEIDLSDKTKEERIEYVWDNQLDIRKGRFGKRAEEMMCNWTYKGIMP